MIIIIIIIMMIIIRSRGKHASYIYSAFFLQLYLYTFLYAVIMIIFY